MIWLSRLFAVLIGILFLLLLPIALIAFRVDETLFEPDFYIEELRKADFYNFLYNDALPALVEENLEQTDELPFQVLLTTDELVSSIQRVVPLEWIQEQMERVIEQGVPYLTGREDHFQITVPLSGRAETALEVIREILHKSDTYDLLFDEVISPQIEGALGQFAELPLGITITNDEVIAALRQIVPPEWVQEQVDNLINEVGPYVVGEKDSFQIVVPLRERVDVALRLIEETADRKLDEVFIGLPECTPTDLLRLVEAGLTTQLPQCRPPGIGLEDIKGLLDLNLGDEVRRAIGDQLPDSLTYTDQDLRRNLTQAGQTESLELLDEARKVIRDGFTYTDADLQEDLREIDVDAVDILDQVRRNVNRARSNRIGAYIVLGVLLVLTGFLGARTWMGRLSWSAVWLAIASALVFAISGPVYRSLSAGRLESIFEQCARDNEGVSLIFCQKGESVAKMVTTDFLAGIEDTALRLLIIASIAVALSVILPVVARLVSPGRRGSV